MNIEEKIILKIMRKILFFKLMVQVRTKEYSAGQFPVQCRTVRNSASVGLYHAEQW